MKSIRILLLYAQNESWMTLSYATSLPGAIGRSPIFDVTPVNLGAFGAWDEALFQLRASFVRFDAVFVLHSVFSNACYMPDRLADRIAGLRLPVVYFVGNEYKSMPAKMALARRLGTTLLVSQIASPDVLSLYAKHLGCRAIFLPNAVADPLAFPPGPPLSARPIDIGYRAFDGVKYLGHEDRRRIAELVEPAASAKRFVCDVSLDPTRRLAAGDWLKFLHSSKAQLGVEAGTDYFELDDHSRLKGNELEVQRPNIGFEEYKKIVFGDGAGRVSGRTITSRHLECATSRTLMVMFPGDYCGAFEADQHYIAVARDGSNLEDVLTRLRDIAYCEVITAAAEKAALDKFGEAASMTKLAKAIQEIVS